MAQLMPLPLTVSCFSKIQIGFTFLVPARAHPGCPGRKAVKRVCACVCVLTYLLCVLVSAEEMLHEVQMYSQITPMEIDILFQLADCRHPDGFVVAFF